MAKWRDPYTWLGGTIWTPWSRKRSEADGGDPVEGKGPTEDSRSGGVYEGHEGEAKVSTSRPYIDIDDIIEEQIGYSNKIMRHILSIRVLLDTRALDKDRDQFALQLPEQVYKDYCAFQGLSASSFVEAEIVGGPKMPVTARLYGTRIRLIPQKAVKTIEVDGVKYQEVRDD